MDDNFASVVEGVREGRQIFTNLKRSYVLYSALFRSIDTTSFNRIQYTVSHSVPEVVPQLLYVVAPIPLPLPAILILVIDLGFELCAALSFAWDKPESAEALMTMRPRKPVTPASIMTLKKKALRRNITLAKAATHDSESGAKRAPSWLARKASDARLAIKAPFTKHFWLDKFARDDSETLVDLSLLSYAYLQIGIIMTIGSMLAYFTVFYWNGFTPSELIRMQSDTAAGYFVESAPDFINFKGDVRTGHDQREALAQAESIVYWSICERL